METLQAGDRIELIYMNDPDPVPPGTRGTVVGVIEMKDWTQIDVDWDNGRQLMLTEPPDKYRIINE